MGRPNGSDDKDYTFLDNNIALANDIREYVEAIKDLSDNPNVLLIALKVEATALIIQRRSRDYRLRIKAIKKTLAQTRVRG